MPNYRLVHFFWSEELPRKSAQVKNVVLETPEMHIYSVFLLKTTTGINTLNPYLYVNPPVLKFRKSAITF